MFYIHLHTHPESNCKQYFWCVCLWTDGHMRFGVKFSTCGTKSVFKIFQILSILGSIHIAGNENSHLYTEGEPVQMGGEAR